MAAVILQSAVALQFAVDGRRDSMQEEAVISPWLITAVPLSLEQAIDLFINCYEKAVLAPGILAGDDLQYCATVFSMQVCW